jgi:hypothetical protein
MNLIFHPFDALILERDPKATALSKKNKTAEPFKKNSAVEYELCL